MAKYAHGLCVMRCQPFHIGHANIINTMLEKCGMVTVVLGSIQVQRSDQDEKNPFNYLQRKQMIKNYYETKSESKRLNIIGAADINDLRMWSKYILDLVKDQIKDAPLVDVYFAGTVYDTRGWEYSKLPFEIIDRTDGEFPYTSGTMIRNMCMFQDVRWKLYVPECNWELVRQLENDYFYTRK